MTPANDVFRAMEQLVRNEYAPSEPGAAILVVKNGQTLYRQGVGLANLEHGVPIEPEMPFHLASLTKPLTATAILMLEEAGQLALDDPLTRFLPDYPLGKTIITLEHLLTHTSGVKNYTELPEWWAVHRQDFSVHELIGLFSSKPRVSAPGTRWAYNNSGYALLGAVIEKISEKPYGQFIEERIFAPLGMQHSYYAGTSSQVIPKLVSGYSGQGPTYSHPEYLSYTQVYAAGGLIASVDELATWYLALCNGQVIRKTSLQRAWSPYLLADGSSSHYGYGWMLSTYQGHRLVEHYGLLPGYANYLIGLPDDNLFVAVLSNQDGKIGQPERLAFELAALALEQPYHPPTPIDLSPEKLQAYAGQYQARDGAVLMVQSEADGLILQTADGQSWTLQPISPEKFFFPQLPMSEVNFVLDTNQQAVELNWLPRQKIPIQAIKSAPKII
jgi:D-alanyl-D-alanine carboxypeptidase